MHKIYIFEDHMDVFNRMLAHSAEAMLLAASQMLYNIFLFYLIRQFRLAVFIICPGKFPGTVGSE